MSRPPPQNTGRTPYRNIKPCNLLFILKYAIIYTENKRAKFAENPLILANKTKMKNRNKTAVYGKKLFIIPIVCFFSILFLLPQNSFAKADSNEIFDLVNGIRKENNLARLEENELLNQAALERAQDMFKSDYFSHKSPAGKTFLNELEKFNYYFETAGENLAIDFYDNQKLLDAWAKSPAHLKNILNPEFSETGVAKAGNVVVQIFAKPTQEKNRFYLFINNQKEGRVLGAYIVAPYYKSVSFYLILGVLFFASIYLVSKNKYN